MFENESKPDLQDLLSQISSKILGGADNGKRSLVEYAQATTVFDDGSRDLDPWQEFHLLPLLERFAHEQRLKIMIHAPPQHGKSIFVSGRLPAYLLGMDPLTKVCQCAFNEERAMDFSRIAMETVQSPEHLAFFGGDDRSLPTGVTGSAPSAKSWRTKARKAISDTQVSLKAVGLATGVVGSGFNHIIVDDPYGSYDDSISIAGNRHLWYLYTRVIKPRLRDANMLWMFHRWNVSDIIGKILEEEPNEWLYVRFPAIADDNEDGSDPTGRAPGELLSPRMTMEDYGPIMEKDPGGWMSLFQGTPTAEEGGLIRPEKFNYWDEETDGKLPEFKRYYRAWDLAAAKDESRDWTVGVLMANDGENVYILDIQRFQNEWPETQKRICEIAESDPPGTINVMEQVALSIIAVQSLRKTTAFRKRPILGVVQQKDKRMAALDWAKRCDEGKIFVKKAKWNAKFADECRIFDGLELSADDQVDAVSLGYKMIWKMGPGIRKHEKRPEWLSHAWLREMRRLKRNEERTRSEEYGDPTQRFDEGDAA